MKRQVIMIILLCVFSIMARGQNTNTVSDVQSDTLKKTEQRQKCHRTPVNDYSGLNSLRARLANRFWDGQSDTTKFQDAVDERIVHTDGHGESSETVSTVVRKGRGEESTGNLYIDKILSSGMAIGVPLLVFFKGGGTELTDSSQMLNIKAVAELAKKYGFRIRITGSADSATGSAETNEAVAYSRARYILDVLKKEGLLEENILIQAVGGVNLYIPAFANRNCIIEMIL